MFNKQIQMSKRSKVALWLLFSGALLASIGYLTLNRQAMGPDELHVGVKVFSIPAADLPLCDEKRTVKPCAATKVDWNKLEVIAAPSVTRSVVGSSFLPNAKE